MLQSQAFVGDTYGFLKKYDIIVASIVVWRSYFAHSCCQKYCTLFCHKFTFVVIYAPNSGKTVVAQSVLV